MVQTDDAAMAIVRPKIAVAIAIIVPTTRFRFARKRRLDGLQPLDRGIGQTGLRLERIEPDPGIVDAAYIAGGPVGALHIMYQAL